METLEISKYEFARRHSGCRYNGKLMRCSLHKIDGHYHPPTESTVEWLWCNGRIWDIELRMWKICGYSTRDKPEEIAEL